MVSGLCCVSEVNWTGTLRPEARVKVLEPSAEVAFAKTCGFVAYHVSIVK